MEFHRINKNTLQCKISDDELEDYGISMEDFFNDQEKVHGFLETIMKEAEERIGYHFEGDMLGMQIMRLPNHELCIIVSERADNGLKDMFKHLQNLVNLIDEDDARQVVDNLQDSFEMDNADMIDSDIKKERVPKPGKNSPEDFDKQVKNAEKKLKKKNSEPKVFRFEKMADLEDFAVSVEVVKGISSKLYHDLKSEKYYLLLKKGKAKLADYVWYCKHAIDYGIYESDKKYFEQYCKEHYECLIPKRAMQSIRDYSIV